MKYDVEAQVWLVGNKHTVRQFFHAPHCSIVTILKDYPQTNEEKERYNPECKLYKIKWDHDNY